MDDPTRPSQHEFAFGPALGHAHVPERTLAVLAVLAYGHDGRPVLVVATEAGRAWDLENNGMVDAVADLVEAGRVKLYCVDTVDDWLYCVDTVDDWSWSDGPSRPRSVRAGTASTSTGCRTRSSRSSTTTPALTPS